MAKKFSLPELPVRIQKLLEERQQHVDAVERIDVILTSVGAALVAKTTAPLHKATTAHTPAGKKRRRRRTKYAMSAEASILAFVKGNKNPTTQEIKKHYFGEGRGGSADNVLSKLFREKKLKRTPLGKGIRGSRYSLI